MYNKHVPEQINGRQWKKNLSACYWYDGKRDYTLAVLLETDCKHYYLSQGAAIIASATEEKSKK